MGLLGASFKTEVVKADGLRERMVPVVKVRWNGDGADTYYSDGPFLNCLPLVEDISSIAQAIQLRSPSSVQRVETTVTLSDTSRSLCAKLEGAYDLRRSTVTIYWAFPNLAESSWHLVFTGVVDRWEAVRAGWKVTCRTDDFWMDGYVTKVPLLGGDWASIPESSRGIYSPVVYGVHDSSNHSSRGFVGCPPGSWVLNTTGIYVVSLGVCQSVDRVCVDGTPKTLTTHYTVQQGVSYGGKTWTTVTFTNGNIPTDSQRVTVDVKGLTDNGAVGGSAITNPVTQLRHAITNFLHGDWRSGSWKPESGSPIDPTSWDDAASWASAYRLDGNLVLGGESSQEKASDVISRWLNSYGVFRLYWTNAGKLGIKVVPVEHPGYGQGTDFDTVQPHHEIGASFQTRMDTQTLVQRISASYLADNSQNKTWNSLDVQDLNQDEKNSESVSMDNGPARVN